jgi:hypothetical protein
MDNDHPTHYGPEHLEELADRLSSSGDSFNAVPLRQMAKAWTNTSIERDAAFAENSAMQQRLSAIAAAATAPTTN